MASLPTRLRMRPPQDRGPSYQCLGATATTDGAWESLGDLGWMGDQGYRYLAGHNADLVLVGDANGYPAELEAALSAVPGVLDMCVIGLPNDGLGEVPHAIVRVSRALEEETLRAPAVGRLMRYKQPRSYEIVTDPLRDDAGKVQRSALRAART